MPSKPKLKKITTHPTKIDKNMLDRAIQYISEGCPYKIACHSVGFSYKQFKTILNQGMLDLDHEVDSYQAFIVRDLRSLERDKITNCLALIQNSEKGHSGAQWILERKHWKHFSGRAETLALAEELEEIKERLEAQEKIK